VVHVGGADDKICDCAAECGMRVNLFITEVDNDDRLGLACLKESESGQAIESSSTCSRLRATPPTRQCGCSAAVFSATVTTEAHSPPAEAAD
jgi:hypothetical protein